MKKMYNVIVAMIIMVITAAPVFAGTNVDKNARSDKKEVRMKDRKFDKNKKADNKFDKKVDNKFDKKVDKSRDRHMTVIEVVTFKVNNKAMKGKNVVAAAKAVYGVKDVKWNPRKGMMTVTYDAKKTTARRIKAAVN